MIISKQKATMAIAIAFSMDHALEKYIQDPKISKKHFSTFIHKLKQNTLYKNIWVQIIDKDATPLYKSYTKNNKKNLKYVRKDVNAILQHPKILSSINAGYCDLTFNSMVPIYNKKHQFIAIFEIASHFNSIAKLLEKDNIDSIVVATKETTQNLTNPFTKIFVDHRYVTNLNAKEKLLKFLSHHKVSTFTKTDFIIKNNYLIVNYPLKDIKHYTIANYLMFIPMEKITQKHVYPIIRNNAILTSIAILLLLSFVGIFFHYNDNKLKKYYKRILDSSSNIIIITDGKQLLDVNQVFFNYFNKVSSLEKFRKKYATLCNLFIEEKNYLHKYMNKQHWLTYLITNPENEEKVKINYEGNIHYFIIKARPLTDDKTQYSIVMVDITKEEEYKQKLFQESITDPLTTCYNRRYFEIKTQEEISASKRYNYPLSFIMFDIDFFKKINDTYGHDAGDIVLKNLVKNIRKIIRKSDTLYRVGGEEFILMLPYTDEKASFELAERIRSNIIDKELAKGICITLSLGVITIQDETLESAYKKVDNALYKAKQNGRNQVVKG